jgi:hypothetical protein
MRHWMIAGLSAFSFAGAAAAEEITSVYTGLDTARDCTTFAASTDEGDFANMACNGYGGYPVLVYSGDLRESIYYGFPKTGQAAPAWESFSAFNSAGPKVEWRVSKDGGRTIPFATIHRWFVSDDPDAPDRRTEVLVVEKVGQLDGEEGCAVGLVVASGNPGANETARRIADEQARDFACGDERVLVGEPMPSFERQAN